MTAHTEAQANPGRMKAITESINMLGREVAHNNKLRSLGYRKFETSSFIQFAREQVV